MTRDKHEDKMMYRQFAAENFPRRDESVPNTKQNTLRYSNWTKPSMGSLPLSCYFCQFFKWVGWKICGEQNEQHVTAAFLSTAKVLYKNVLLLLMVSCHFRSKFDQVFGLVCNYSWIVHLMFFTMSTTELSDGFSCTKKYKLYHIQALTFP